LIGIINLSIRADI